MQERDNARLPSEALGVEVMPICVPMNQGRRAIRIVKSTARSIAGQDAQNILVKPLGSEGLCRRRGENTAACDNLESRYAHFAK